MFVYLLLTIVEEYFAEISRRDDVVAVSRDVLGRSSLRVVLERLSSEDRPRKSSSALIGFPLISLLQKLDCRRMETLTL